MATENEMLPRLEQLMAYINQGMSFPVLHDDQNFDFVGTRSTTLSEICGWEEPGFSLSGVTPGQWRQECNAIILEDGAQNERQISNILLKPFERVSALTCQGTSTVTPVGVYLKERIGDEMVRCGVDRVQFDDLPAKMADFIIMA